ncbi:21614_t:CDS:2, partial [Rhizophagus irregularis]
KYQIGEYLCYNDNNRRKLGRLLAILYGNDGYKLKIQRILTYNELPTNFKSNSRSRSYEQGEFWLLDRNENNAVILIEPQDVIKRFTNLSDDFARIAGDWFIIEEQPYDSDIETNVQTNAENIVKLSLRQRISILKLGNVSVDLYGPLFRSELMISYSDMGKKLDVSVSQF